MLSSSDNLSIKRVKAKAKMAKATTFWRTKPRISLIERHKGASVASVWPPKAVEVWKLLEYGWERAPVVIGPLVAEARLVRPPPVFVLNAIDFRHHTLRKSCWRWLAARSQYSFSSESVGNQFGFTVLIAKSMQAPLAMSAGYCARQAA